MKEITIKIQIPEHLENLFSTLGATLQGSTPAHKPSEDENEIWTVDDLSAALKIPKSKIYGLTMRTDKNSLPRFKIGRKLRFKKSEALNWFDQQRAV